MAIKLWRHEIQPLEHMLLGHNVFQCIVFTNTYVADNLL